jgi:site-specific DNA-methyltransferase (adenine-specific)
MARLPENSADAFVGDPPYGLGFLGREWDHGVPGPEFWSAALRVAKPGALLLMAGGTRNYHRLACAIEDGGWDVFDMVEWVYGSGKPQSLDVSKAIDKALGAVRAKVRIPGRPRNPKSINGGEGVKGGDRPWMVKARELGYHETDGPVPVTPQAAAWDGCGTALKPAHEPFCFAMKPMEGTYAKNILAFGAGAMQIRDCRVEPTGESRGRDGEASAGEVYDDRGVVGFAATPGPRGGAPEGRWPANLIHDGSPEALSLFPDAPGQQGATTGDEPSAAVGAQWGKGVRVASCAPRDDATRTAARFFYCAKPTTAEREAGLGEIDAVMRAVLNKGGLCNDPKWAAKSRHNDHPTVKPIELMRYLVRLACPQKDGVVVDPFMGSGSTGCACALEGKRFIGFEIDPRYVAISKARIRYWAGLNISPKANYGQGRLPLADDTEGVVES